MIRRLLSIIGLCILLWACGPIGAADGAVGEIAVALGAGDTAGAQKAADALLSDTTAFNALSAGQLCRLSQLLVRIDPDKETEDNDAYAARCLARARALSPDTVVAFLRSLSGDDAGRLMVLDRVGTYLEIPRDSLVSAEDISVDSISQHNDHE